MLVCQDISEDHMPVKTMLGEKRYQLRHKLVAYREWIERRENINSMAAQMVEDRKHGYTLKRERTYLQEAAKSMHPVLRRYSQREAHLRMSKAEIMELDPWDDLEKLERSLR